MNTASANLADVLALRERRRQFQCKLLAAHGAPLVSFTLNIPGPHKSTPLTNFAFDRFVRRILDNFGTPLTWTQTHTIAGPEAFFVYSTPADKLKALAMRLEETSPVGRLLDIDVLREDGTKLSRSTECTCLICGAPAAPCARSRAHSLAQLEEKTNELLYDFTVEELGSLAVSALLFEARLTPKPGLVDSANSGSHSDMDLALMERSAGALLPYFSTCARIGLHDSSPAALQQAGIAAEEIMLRRTQGVNTHKGAIYTLGLLCAAYAKSMAVGGDVFALAAQSAQQLTVSDNVKESHGDFVRQRYGAFGIRAEACNGFPHVQTALALLRTGGSPLRALTLLMEQVEDTNLLYRGGEEGLRFVRTQAAALRTLPEQELFTAMRQLDRACIARHLSPGGSADLLAAALFLRSLDSPSPRVDHSLPQSRQERSAHHE